LILSWLRHHNFASFFVLYNLRIEQGNLLEFGHIWPISIFYPTASSIYICIVQFKNWIFGIFLNLGIFDLYLYLIPAAFSICLCIIHLGVWILASSWFGHILTTSFYRCFFLNLSLYCTTSYLNFNIFLNLDIFSLYQYLISTCQHVFVLYNLRIDFLLLLTLGLVFPLFHPITSPSLIFSLDWTTWRLNLVRVSMLQLHETTNSSK